MIDGLLWLDASPARYFTFAVACLLFCVVLALLPIFRPLRSLLESVPGRSLFVAACALALFAFRWPFLAFPMAFNPDEAQFVAQALTFVHDPFPWKSFDGNNAGPLDTAVIALPAAFGVSPSYLAARTIGLLLIAGAIACIYGLVTRLYGELAGRIAALFPLTFFATAVSRDFIHYTSETLSLFLLGVSGVALAWMDREPLGRARFAAFTGGLALGALPLAKVQAVPIVLVLAVAALIVAGRRRLREPGKGQSLIVPLVAGLAAVPLVTLIFVVATGVFGDFWISYILMPLEYDYSIAPQSASYIVRPNLGFAIFAALGVGGGLALLVAAFLLELARGRNLSRNAGQWFPPLIAGATLIAADYAVARPHSDYVHYLLWFVMPISALFGSGVGILLNAVLRTAATKRWLVPVLALSLAAYATVPGTNYRLSIGYPLYASFAREIAPLQDPILAMLGRHIVTGDRISVWGWEPDFYVSTGALLGTRDAITQFQIVPSSHRAYYRARYLADFAASRPRFFVDAVTPSTFAYHDRSSEGPQAFPELAQIVATQYRQVGESYGVRLYERIR